jgi:predicted DNA-binding protein with PD1-like motif
VALASGSTSAGNELEVTENHELLALNGTLSETLMLE